jgi:RimJ/RimL family protein N-acetyltransferase
MSIADTNRLRITELAESDADFILELLNTPGFLEYIGDRGVRNRDDALRYIREGPGRSYAANGFGLWRVGLIPGGEAIGIAGLLKRDSLPDVDIGFAFLPSFCGYGYAHESSSAIMRYAEQVLGLKRVVAITARENDRSIALLHKLGFVFEEMIRMPGDVADVRLFGCNLA